MKDPDSSIAARQPARGPGKSLRDLAVAALEQRSRLRILVFAAVPLGLALLVPVLGLDVMLAFSDPVRLSDPVHHRQLPVYAGFMSYLGILIWWGAAAACLTAAAVIPAGAAQRALLVGGCFTGLLALDDLFLLHEVVLPSHGIPENLVLAGYAAAGTLYLVALRRFHLGLEWPLLCASLGLLGVSVALDVLLPRSGLRVMLMEDASKFAGIVAWSAYHLRAALSCLRREVGRDAPAR